MAKCTQTVFAFPSCKSRKVSADFSGGNITSFGGLQLLRLADDGGAVSKSGESCLKSNLPQGILRDRRALVVKNNYSCNMRVSGSENISTSRPPPCANCFVSQINLYHKYIL